MPELKLAKLPDRKPVKLVITLQPKLNTKLEAYAAAYREAYGDDEKVCDLAPYMLESFLAADKGFAKARKNGGGEQPSATNTLRRKEPKPKPQQ